MLCYIYERKTKTRRTGDFYSGCVFAVGAVLLLWYLAPWVLNRILNAGNVLGIAFAVVLLLCGMFAQPVTHLLAPGNHAPGAVVLKAVVALVCTVAVLTSGYMLTGLIQTGHREETVLVLGCSVKGNAPPVCCASGSRQPPSIWRRTRTARLCSAAAKARMRRSARRSVCAGSWCAGDRRRSVVSGGSLHFYGGKCGFFGQNYRTKRTKPPCDGGDL